MTIFYLTFLISTVSATCPTILCGSYSTHLCGIFTDDSIEISPCLGSDICNIQDLYTNWEQGNTGLPCKKNSLYPNTESLEELMKITCLKTPDLGKKLQGIHPKVCSSNNDCTLADGSVGECKCGLSIHGFSYCEISEADDLSLSVQKAACDKDADLFILLLLKQEFWVYLHDRPLCAGFVFEDIASIDYLSSGGTTLSKIAEFSGSFFISFVGIMYFI
ncbi:hypothetical protein SteCoe_32766 [Stentor coeruleus]|uniref:EGF-like domain-containing protein n=1 Tax=Stentor coeruleus TaxID=5963 RepID=A0A1R2AYB2_9CILI|nr:hypothetical protein SteCoe_32766 [Stentor coeruleus]